MNIELMEIRTQKCSLCGYLVDSILYELCKRAIFSNFYQTFTICRCRIPHGMRGLKFRGSYNTDVHAGRIPHGMRGLKYVAAVHVAAVHVVASRMGCVD